LKVYKLTKRLWKLLVHYKFDLICGICKQPLQVGDTIVGSGHSKQRWHESCYKSSIGKPVQMTRYGNPRCPKCQSKLHRVVKRGITLVFVEYVCAKCGYSASSLSKVIRDVKQFITELARNE